MGIGDMISKGVDKLNKAMSGNTLSFAEFDYSSMENLKAELHIFEKLDASAAKEKLKLFLNPTTIKVTRSVKVETIKPANHGQEIRYKNSEPPKLEIGELWFDGYEDRVNVRDKYITKLEELVHYKGETHHIPCVQFVWGSFNVEPMKYYVTGMTVEYTMFLPDGTPVRAKVGLTLSHVMPVAQQQQEKPMQSPDHAKVYTVRRGDTLQAIAMAEYEDAREWRRIAQSNSITDPMNLKPGTKLLVPPILK